VPVQLTLAKVLAMSLGCIQYIQRVKKKNKEKRKNKKVGKKNEKKTNDFTPNYT